MKTYNTLEELKKDIVDNTLCIDDDIKINFILYMNSLSIKAWDINAWDIDARDIKARNIDARDINANNIDARNINANNIDATNISYGASCCTRDDLICDEIKSHHPNGKHWSLNGKVIINGKEQTQ